MPQILIRPQELRQASEQLQATAKKIDVALKAIDQEILSLKGDKFLGNRANAVQAHYAPKREALLKAKSIIVHFSEDMRSAATRFEQADRSGSEQSAGEASSKPQPSLVTPSKPTNNKMPKISDIVLNQWDKRWANTIMNNRTNHTLKNYGCLMTVISMIARANGVNITPDMVDKWNDKNGAYANGSNMLRSAQEKFLSETLGKNINVSDIYQANAKQSGLPNIAKYLNNGTPVVLHINHPNNQQDGHFVLAVGIDSKGNYICADPDGGKQSIVPASQIRSARVYN